MSRRDGAIIAWHQVPETAHPKRSQAATKSSGATNWIYTFRYSLPFF
jgi:hypothetical protein